MFSWFSETRSEATEFEKSIVDGTDDDDDDEEEETQDTEGKM